MRRVLILAALLAALHEPSSASAAPVKVLDNGNDALHYVIVVLGEGYTAAEQKKFHSDVLALVVNGALNLDYYAYHHSAFNVYRIDLVSTDSGVSKPRDPKNTALGLTYEGLPDGTCCVEGDWWYKKGTNTLSTIDNELLALQSRVDAVVVLVNTAAYGAATQGNHTYAGAGSTSAIHVLACRRGGTASTRSSADRTWTRQRPGADLRQPPDRSVGHEQANHNPARCAGARPGRAVERARAHRL
jgi:hypothetical protein